MIQEYDAEPAGQVVIAGGPDRQRATRHRWSAPQAIEHRKDLAQPGLGELVDREATAVADGDQPGVPEPAQVVGQPCGRYPQQLAQLTGRGGTPLEALKHGVPGLVRQFGQQLYSRIAGHSHFS